MTQPLSPQQRQDLMAIIREELVKPRPFPHDVDQIAFEMMDRVGNWLWYQQLVQQQDEENERRDVEGHNLAFDAA